MFTNVLEWFRQLGTTQDDGVTEIVEEEVVEQESVSQVDNVVE